MTISDFKSSLQNQQPPPKVNGLLLALWYDAKGDWNSAHTIAQDVQTRDGSWMHAYLHRKEGDESNAGYWYDRAGRKFSKTTLDEEWEELAKHFLAELF